MQMKKRIIFHIDVNSAFLSWTAVDMLKKGYKTDIRNTISGVGGAENTRNGIITAASIAAKKKGIRAGMPIFKAREIDKNFKIYPSNYELYNEMSHSLFKLLSKYSPDIEVASIDECYLDYTKVKLLYGDEIVFAEKLRNDIYHELGFTVNIGIGNNKLCAKMASDFEKPNKTHTLYMEEVETKMYPLEVGELYGIGKKTVPVLNKIGIYTIEHLAKANPVILGRYFKNQAKQMIASAKGIDNAPVDPTRADPKSIGHEFTKEQDLTTLEQLNHELLLLSEMVGVRLRKEGKYASVICVIYKDNLYRKRKSHQRKLVNATDLTADIYLNAKQILKEMYDGEPIRLIGIRLDGLTEHVMYQESIFENPDYR